MRRIIRLQGTGAVSFSFVIRNWSLVNNELQILQGRLRVFDTKVRFQFEIYECMESKNLN